MLRKLVVLILVGATLMAPIMTTAAIGEKSQLHVTAKIGTTGPVIRLASNDVVSPQAENRKSVTKSSNANDSDAVPSTIPAQAWLILAALFCFVMRSSRRVV